MMLQNPSSLSAKVSFPDHERIKAELTELAKNVVKKKRHIQAIYLFGSRATGNFSARSDADLLIILDQDARRPIDRIPEYLEIFLDAPVPVDVFPSTRHETAQNPLAIEAMKNAVLLCEK